MSCGGAQQLRSLKALRGAEIQRQQQRAVGGNRLTGGVARALFTGIVQGKAEVAELRRKTDFSSLDIRFPAGAADGVRLGASVAINGTCLTVTRIDQSAVEGVLSFDVISETLRATNLGLLDLGSHVNFERSARMGDEIGGHNVSGHVHTTADVTEVLDTENNRRLTFSVRHHHLQVPSKWMKYILAKGYVAVDGCSLTVGEVGEDWFTVYLIPETLRTTVLGGKREGSSVNIEIDAQTQAIVNTVEQVVARYMKEQQPAVSAAVC